MRLRRPAAPALGDAARRFADYQETEAWTWSTWRDARAGGVGVAASRRVSRPIRAVLTRPRDASSVAGDVVKMRGAIAQVEGDGKPLDLKICRRRPGRSRIHRPISAARATPQRCPHPRHLDHARARQGVAAGLLAPEHAEVLRPAVVSSHLTTDPALCCPDRSIRRPLAGLDGSYGARHVPDSDARRLRAETQAKVRATFVKVPRRCAVMI